MLYAEVVNVCSLIRNNYGNTICGQNVYICMVNLMAHNSNHWVSVRVACEEFSFVRPFQRISSFDTLQTTEAERITESLQPTPPHFNSLDLAFFHWRRRRRRREREFKHVNL